MNLDKKAFYAFHLLQNLSNNRGYMMEGLAKTAFHHHSTTTIQAGSHHA